MSSKFIYFFLENLTLYEIKWKNILEPDRSQVTIQYGEEKMQTNQTHLQYLILIPFPLQQLLGESPSVLRYAYIACLVLTCGQKVEFSNVKPGST